MSDDTVNPEASREELERRAQLSRARLLNTIDRIEKRGRDLTNVSLQVRRHAVPVLAVGAIAVVAVTAAVSVWVARAPMRAKRSRYRRWALLANLVRHPERVVERPSAGRGIAFKIARGLATAIVVEVAKRAIRRALAAPPSAPETVVAEDKNGFEGVEK